MSKCLVLFVEGATEVEFYKRVIANARELRKNHSFDTFIECKNINGVGGFKNIALRKFIKEIKPKYDSNCVYTIVLCRDTDIFELSPKPPIRWEEVERNLRENGANDVIHVEAIHSIEDWYLYDIDGILAFLRLSKKTKVSGKNGYDKLKNLYRKANKMYYKGMKSNDMVNRLDVDKIVKAVEQQLNPLYKVLGVDKFYFI
jgi:hypothetical protein